MEPVRYRHANRDDAPAVFTVVSEVWPEIPYPPMHEPAKVLEQLQSQLAMGRSAVATDNAGKVIGFVVATPQRYRGPEQPSGTRLHHAGVTKSWRGQNIFPMMIDTMKRHGRPLFGGVPRRNQFHMIERLLRLGFKHVGSGVATEEFSWTP